jgi:DNA-binding CsgD family transcriptional regulator
VWWRGDVIAVNVVFRPPGAGFSTGVVDAVEAVTQTVAPALHLVRPDAARTLAAALRTGRPRLRITETGGARPVPDTVATAAADVLTALDAVLGTPDPPQRVGIVHRPAGLRLLVQREAPGAVDAAAVLAALRAVVGPRAEAVLVELVPGWGLAVQVDLPDPVPAPPAGPLTDREREVLGLLRRGLTDRAMAAALGRSPKTVEKHVAALIRKTGALNRTAAVAAAMERGWLPDR